MRDEPEKERNDDTDNEASDDRKVEGSVFAAVHDVAGQFSQAKRKLVPEAEKRTDQNKERSEENKRATEFAKRLHRDHLTRSGK